MMVASLDPKKLSARERIKLLTEAAIQQLDLSEVEELLQLYQEEQTRRTPIDPERQRKSV